LEANRHLLIDSLNTSAGKAANAEYADERVEAFLRRMPELEERPRFDKSVSYFSRRFRSGFEYTLNKHTLSTLYLRKFFKPRRQEVPIYEIPFYKAFFKSRTAFLEKIHGYLYVVFGSYGVYVEPIQREIAAG